MVKTLLLDIETAPSLAYIWSLWKEPSSMDFVIDDWYILCWSAKWLGEKKVHSSSLVDFDLYKKDKTNDSLVMKELWKLLDEADIVITHNGIKFDNRKINTRFVLNNIKPPSPYKMVDTLIIARNHFGFMSNRLNDLGKFLGLGEKNSTGGFKLWKECLSSNMKSWKTMIDYCKRDVTLLEDVYLKLRPFATGLPNYGVYNEDESLICPRCGSKELIKRGFAYTNTSRYQRYRCDDCGTWSRGRTNEHTKEKMKALVTNIS